MIGQIIGNYKIEQKLGEGGMGAVYKGIDTMLDREVAIKALRPELASQTAIVERFRSEAVTLAKLHHPNIATLYSLFRQRDELYMVLEYVRGETLDTIIQKRGALSSEEAIPVFCQVLDGIDHAHKFGIVHRDIKPANIMLAEDGKLKVLDFGIARLLGSTRMTRAGNIIGTLEYMAPEQILGHETDPRSDIYALGTMLYEMLTGRTPFVSENEFVLMKLQTEQTPIPPGEINPAIPEEVQKAIMCAIEKDPARRFQTAGEFRESLIEAGFATQGKMNASTGNRVAQIGAPHLAAQIPLEPISSPVSQPSLTGAEIENSVGETAAATALVSEQVMKEIRLSESNTLITGAAATDFNKLTKTFSDNIKWIHYVGAGLAAAFLIGLSVITSFLISGGSSNTNSGNINSGSGIGNASINNINTPTVRANTNESAKTKIEEIYPPPANTNGLSNTNIEDIKKKPKLAGEMRKLREAPPGVTWYVRKSLPIPDPLTLQVRVVNNSNLKLNGQEIGSLSKWKNCAMR